MVELCRSLEEARAFIRRVRDQDKTLALVPTMGFLHDGHLSLIKEGKRRADVGAATIFVNPTQFGPNEDLSRYPRDLEGDLAKCRSAGATMVWAPPPDEVYPKGFQTVVQLSELSQGLCGEKRPGHFAGVATVVAKLLALFRPEVALFGEKDFQQLRIIEQLNEDLNLGVEIVGMPIIREPDGLAMSSRNAYLKGEDRGRALALSRGLAAAQRKAAAGEVDAKAITAAARAELDREQLKVDYVELVDRQTLKPVERLSVRPSRLLVAAFVAATRLIDNVEVRGTSP